MKIFKQIKDSIYNPEYYKEVTEKPFSYSFKFLLVFALFFALVFTVVVTIKFIPLINLLSQKAPEMANYFPQELAVTIKDGKASTNVQEPYFVKMPEVLKNNEALNSSNATINGYPAKKITQLDNIVVINTKNKFDINTFNSYKTFLLLTADNIVYLKDGQITISSISDIKDFTLNKSKVVDFINMIKPFIVVLYPIVFVGAYIIGYIVVMVEMFYLLFGALLVWLIAKIKGVKIGYKKAYQLGMHLIITAIIITGVLNIFSFKSPIPSLFSILLIASAAINLRKEVASQTPSSV